MSLRSVLELGLLSVYYNINDEGHKTVIEWLGSKSSEEASTPRAGKIWKILNKNDNIRVFNEKYDLKKESEELGFLHDYTHSKGYGFSNILGRLKANFQTFEQDVLMSWLETCERVVRLILTLHLLKYPIGIVEYDWGAKLGFGHGYPVLRISTVRMLKSFLPEEHVLELERIAESDPQVRDFLDGVKSEPDVTQEEFEEQTLDFCKSLIENRGYIEFEREWLEVIEALNNKDKENKEMWLNRLEVLKAWALQNNCMESNWSF